MADDGKYSTARALLGKNLHTMQKFYSHSNWIELGNLETIDLISDTLGLIADNLTDTCMDDSEIVGDALTSGYYVSFLSFHLI